MTSPALDQCTRETIELATFEGPQRKPAWRFGDLACHMGVAHLSDVWVITHLPTGMSFSRLGVFADIETCAAAMVEMSRLRNDWTSILQEDLAPLAERLAPVFAKHRAARPVNRLSPAARAASREMMSRRCNGYPLEPSSPDTTGAKHG